MNNKKFHYLLYVIVLVIIATIGIQGYWNYKNYLSNKQQLVNNVQVSLDKAVDDYYANLAEETTLSLRFNKNMQKDTLKDGGILDRISKSIYNNNGSFKGLDSLKLGEIKNITVIKGIKNDSLIKEEDKLHFWHTDSTKKLKKLPIIKSDSTDLNKKFELLTSKVIVSIKNDSLNVKKIDSLLKLSLNNKKIALDYDLSYEITKSRFPSFLNEKTHNKNIKKDSIQNNKILSVTSKSTFLPENGLLRIDFVNINWIAFKKGLSAILISTLLVLAVISCLFFLLNVIKEQKQLAEVKNDLISNITHEFKTPIATIGVALEGIKNFNVIEDKEKTKQYVDMSSSQLSKLNTMVEKLLETATLESESLNFSTEPVNVSMLLDTLVNRYKTQHQEKTFSFKDTDEPITIMVDPFHIENALNNILDNAVKYGGGRITVNLKSGNKNIEILISDNGNGIKKENKNRIFEKFYRVPKGNTHNIKGYGIGLFYTKTIINKHHGTVELELKNNLTTFKMSLPHG